MKPNRALSVLIIIFILIFLKGIVGMSISREGDHPLHQQIADMMYHNFADPRLEHCVTRYGNEFTISETGYIHSNSFFNFLVFLLWYSVEVTY